MATAPAANAKKILFCLYVVPIILIRFVTHSTAYKKSSLGSLEKNAGATLADDFSPFIEFLLFAQWHSVQKNEKVSHLRPCAVQVK